MVERRREKRGKVKGKRLKGENLASRVRS